MEYIEALKQEIGENRHLSQEYEVTTVFFGGGTPSLLPGEQVESVLAKLQSCFSLRENAEITVECNPGTLTAEKLACYRRAGVNRLSIGLQSAHNEELELLGRIHTWEEFLESYQLAREAGFSNINVDLMSGLPGQTLESWRDTLKKVMALEPEHISAYSLIIEEGTLFGERYGSCEGGNAEAAAGAFPGLPDEDTERQMYYDTKSLLEESGYTRYEISNYARPGRECRHNLGYWRRVDYKGFGIGAASLLANCRYQNGMDLASYLKRQFICASREQLTEADALSETMFLGLRTTKGVRMTKQMRQVYETVLKKYMSQGFLEERDGFLCLTEAGTDVSNWILAEFLLDQEELQKKMDDESRTMLHEQTRKET